MAVKSNPYNALSRYLTPAVDGGTAGHGAAQAGHAPKTDLIRPRRLLTMGAHAPACGGETLFHQSHEVFIACALVGNGTTPQNTPRHAGLTQVIVRFGDAITLGLDCTLFSLLFSFCLSLSSRSLLYRIE